jgi:hypothetical protein
LARGYKASRAKKWDEAITEFRSVVKEAPDYVPGRWALVRALVLGGKLDEVPEAYEELVARDFVGSAGRLDKSKELAAVRESPAWAKVGAIRERYRAAWTRDLDKGILFIARARVADEPKLAADGEAALDLKQEVFHFDPESKRYRRLSETDGHAFALNVSPARKLLSLLVAARLARAGGKELFVDPKVMTLDLTTLEQVGPFGQSGRFEQVALGFDAAGQPLYTFTAPGGQASVATFDTAKTGLAKVPEAAPVGGETRAFPNQVLHVGEQAADKVQLSDGASQFTIEGVAKPVVAARPLAQSSLAWSPGHTRLTYAGKLDACKALKAATPDKNELFVYDVEKRSAQRVAAAVSSFQTHWIDDDRLVYESGAGKAGGLHIYDFAAHADTALPTRHGAGLYGVPMLACVEAEAHVDQPVEPTPDEVEGE